MDSQRQESWSPTARFSSVDPSSYGGELDKLLKAQERIADVVKDAVEDRQIHPVTATRIIACVSGQLFGYEEAHGAPRPDESLLGALGGSLSRESRQHAGVS